MDLDPIKTRGLRSLRRISKVLDNPRDLLSPQRTRRRVRMTLHAVVDVGLGLGDYIRRTNRILIVWEQRAVGDPTDMPELEEDLAPLCVHTISDRLPTGFLFIGMDAGGCVVAVSHRGDRGRFRDDQSRACSLLVIGSHEVIGDIPRHRRTRSRERRHPDTVGVFSDGGE